MSVCQCFFGTHLFFDKNEDAIDCWLNPHKKENSCCYPYMQPHPLEQRPQPLLDMANEYTEALLRKQEREQGMRNFATVLGILNTGDGDSLVDAFRPLLDNARRRNMAARGGKQYDGVTEPTGLMNNRNHLSGAWGRMVSFVSL